LEILIQNLQSGYQRLVESALKALYTTLGHGNSVYENHQGSLANNLAIKILQNGWVSIIENLQNHPNEDIRGRTGQLLDKFFCFENNSS